MRVYEKVRTYIVEHHLKQASIAKKAGIPKGTFNAMINGKRTMYADDLRNICYALNVSADTFIDTSRLESEDSNKPESEEKVTKIK